MKIYTKIILDKNNKVLKEEFFEYSGSMALAGIHYDFMVQIRRQKLMEKQAKKEEKTCREACKKTKKRWSKKRRRKKTCIRS